MQIRKHIFSITLSALIILFLASAFGRFMIAHDYLVAYEGACDPSIESCFVGCVDEECSENYYYTDMQKYAPNLLAQCGPHIEECPFASECLPGESQCVIAYCDPELNGEACDAESNEMNL